MRFIMRVGVGRVHPSLRQRIASGRCRFAPGELAAMLGLPLGPPRKVRLVGGLRAGLLPLEFLAAAAKPFKTRAAISKRRRQLIASRLPELLVLGSVHLGGLLEHRVDLLP